MSRFTLSANNYYSTISYARPNTSNYKAPRTRIMSTVENFDEDLKITENEGYIIVFAITQLTSYKFVIYKYCCFALNSLVFFNTQLFPRLLCFYIIISLWCQKYLVSDYSSFVYFFIPLQSFPPKFTICLVRRLLWVGSASVNLYLLWEELLIYQKNSRHS